MFWLISRFPELEHLSPEQRAVLLSRLPRWFHLKLVLRSLLIGLLPSVVVAALSIDRLDWPINPGLAVLAPWALAGALIYQWQIARVRGHLRRSLKTLLKGDTAPFCLNCGYNLTANHSEICPECGASARVE